MLPPRVRWLRSSRGEGVLVEWERHQPGTSDGGAEYAEDYYKVQWKLLHADEGAWSTSDSASRVKGLRCVKAGLPSSATFVFRVAPAVDGAMPPPLFSDPSAPITIPAIPSQPQGGGYGASMAPVAFSPALAGASHAQPGAADLQRANNELICALAEERRANDKLRAANEQLQEQVRTLMAVLTSNCQGAAPRPVPMANGYLPLHGATWHPSLGANPSFGDTSLAPPAMPAVSSFVLPAAPPGSMELTSAEKEMAAAAQAAADATAQVTAHVAVHAAAREVPETSEAEAGAAAARKLVADAAEAQAAAAAQGGALFRL